MSPNKFRDKIYFYSKNEEDIDGEERDDSNTRGGPGVVIDDTPEARELRVDL